MCTSFVWRKGSVLVAMNSDNNAPFTLSTKDPKQFVVSIGGAPSFGVNKDGMFINHLMVDSNGSGAYRRGKNVVHTIKLITDVLSGALVQEDIDAYVSEKEIVNVPNNSCHCMLSDRNGNVWIIEPGRGVISSPADESPYSLMTNFSLVDLKTTGKYEGGGVDRYHIADDLLSQANSMTVDKAFNILEAVKQCDCNWNTAFSLVYSQEENTIYYCYSGDYTTIHRFAFA